MSENSCQKKITFTSLEKSPDREQMRNSLTGFIRLRAENHPAVGAGLDECRRVHYGEMSPQHVGGGPRRPLALPRGRREAAAGFSGTTAVKPWGSIIIAIGVLISVGFSSMLFADEPDTTTRGNRSYLFCKDTSPEKKKENCVIRTQAEQKTSCPRRITIKKCKKKEEKLSVMQKEARRDAKEGMNLKQADNLEGARVAYQKAVLKDPGYAQAHNELGMIYETLGMPVLAEQSFLKSIEANKCYLSAYSNLVSLYEKKGDLVNAALYWEKIIQLEIKELSRDILQATNLTK